MLFGAKPTMGADMTALEDTAGMQQPGMVWPKSSSSREIALLDIAMKAQRLFSGCITESIQRGKNILPSALLLKHRNLHPCCLFGQRTRSQLRKTGLRPVYNPCGKIVLG
jgi:hypothetical protein